MDISVLQIFVEVMRQGSFANVARDRNLDPSSISRAIASLEEELGIRLFQRTTRQLSPTEAGTVYFEGIEPLLEEINQAKSIATDISGQPKGTLKVTTSVAFGHQRIVPLLPDFSSLYPELTVDLLLTDSIVDLLSERIDIAIRLGSLPDSTLIAQKLIQNRYSVCASPNYLQQSRKLQQPSDVIEHNCLLFPLPGFRSRWLFKDRNGNITETPVKGRTIISSGMGLRQCAVAGMGLALLPHWLIEKDLESGILIDVFRGYEVTATDFNSATWLVYPSRNYVPRKLQVFIDFLLKNISA